MTRQRPWILAAIIVAATCATMTPAAAQTSLATLRGKVVDEQGGVLPGATVVVKQAATNFTRTGVTNERGQFYLPSLPAGSYEVTAELSGFGTGKQAVVLRVGQEATADFALKVGNLEETVNVSAGWRSWKRRPRSAVWWTARTSMTCRRSAAASPTWRNWRQA